MPDLVVGPAPFGETLTLLSRTVSGRDSDGNDVWAAVEVELDGCYVWPLTAVELVSGQDLSIDDRKAALPYGTVVVVTDQIRLADGTTYEVSGQPFSWYSPKTGTRGCVEVTLRRVTG